MSTEERTLERDEQTQNWLRENQVQQVRSKVPEPGSFGPEECEDCGGEIPDKRREMGYTRCVGCVEVEERRHGR